MPVFDGSGCLTCGLWSGFLSIRLLGFLSGPLSALPVYSTMPYRVGCSLTIDSAGKITSMSSVFCIACWKRTTVSFLHRVGNAL